MTATAKVAIITGASQGIGAGLVAGFRGAGYAVVGNSRSIGSIVAFAFDGFGSTLGDALTVVTWGAMVERCELALRASLAHPMPIYEYKCPNGHLFEVFHGMTEAGPENCEVCGEAPLVRVLHPVAVHYVTGHWLDVDDLADLAEARNFP